MPRVRVEWLSGRSDAQRAELARRITEAVVDVVGVRPDQISVVFDERPPTHYFRAGVAWSVWAASTVASPDSTRQERARSGRSDGGGEVGKGRTLRGRAGKRPAAENQNAPKRPRGSRPRHQA